MSNITVWCSSHTVRSMGGNLDLYLIDRSIQYEINLERYIDMNNNTSKTAIIVAAVVALALGSITGYALGNNMGDSMSSSDSNSAKMESKEPSAPAADLRVGMNGLLREHVSSSLAVTRNVASEAPQQEVDASIVAQMANAGEIAAAIGSVYGEDAEKQITEMFVEHIEESNNYAKAVAAGDEQAKAASLMELKEYLTEISAFFSGAIDNLPQDTVYGLLEEHETLLNDSVEAYEAGDYKKSYGLERKALTQVSGIADALAGGVVATNPGKF